jgi:DNA-binding NarL/FixJ family response regulator
VSSVARSWSVTAPALRGDGTAEARPEDAARIWRELATGRWRVIAATDEQGTRCLTLERTMEEASVDWNHLTRCEASLVDLASLGISQKVIALDLNWSSSSVSRALGKVRRRLGFKSLVELCRAYRARQRGDLNP